MNDFILLLGWIGLYAPVALGAIGSAVGCAIAGQAAIGATIDTKGGYGRFIGISALPSSQVIYGIVVMFQLLNQSVTPQTAVGMFGIGVGAGVALMINAIYQGKCCASAVLASKVKPEVFGISLAPAAIVEGFAVFAFIFALLAAGELSGS
ncbi:ATP synthase subunit C [Synechococcus sp. PCC 7336]|uniref:ATP synthase subunit C n=1 Tax=Synechococcus sp. PCC 7336 TaxID=195250 RepID=UPI000346B56C|nr:ATP synthase subunit C [Synechococcus sp. PCC 7336]